MEIRGSIIGSEGTAGTTFAGAVNSSYGGGVIEKGQYTGTVENYGAVRGGTFEGKVTNKESGTIKNGEFTGPWRTRAPSPAVRSRTR